MYTMSIHILLVSYVDSSAIGCLKWGGAMCPKTQQKEGLAQESVPAICPFITNSYLFRLGVNSVECFVCPLGL